MLYLIKFYIFYLFLFSLFSAIGVCAAAVGYGIYAYRNKGNMSTSVYLMQLRVGAQGAAVGVLTVGLVYAMGRQYFTSKKDWHWGSICSISFLE